MWISARGLGRSKGLRGSLGLTRRGASDTAGGLGVLSDSTNKKDQGGYSLALRCPDGRCGACAGWFYVVAATLIHRSLVALILWRCLGCLGYPIAAMPCP